MGQAIESIGSTPSLSAENEVLETRPFFILISWDENPRVRAEAKRRPAKQIPHSPLKKDLVIKAFFILNLLLIL